MQEHSTINDQSLRTDSNISHRGGDGVVGGGYNALTPTSYRNSVVVKTQNMLSRMDASKLIQCISHTNTLIKLTRYDDGTKKSKYDLFILA